MFRFRGDTRRNKRRYEKDITAVLKCDISPPPPYTKLKITGYLTWTVRMGCETEARITAVERAQEYADLKPEALPVVDNYRPPKV